LILEIPSQAAVTVVTPSGVDVSPEEAVYSVEIVSWATYEGAERTLPEWVPDLPFSVSAEGTDIDLVDTLAGVYPGYVAVKAWLYAGYPPDEVLSNVGVAIIDLDPELVYPILYTWRPVEGPTVVVRWGSHWSRWGGAIVVPVRNVISSAALNRVFQG